MQEEFLSSPVDICISGGAAFSGKSYALLHDATRFLYHPQFRAVIFRRTTPEIRNPGGLWETSEEIYPLLGGVGMTNALEWRFPSGARIKFAHLEYEKDVYGWLGSQIPYIGFDQLERFESKQFWYLFGRNRSIADIPKYIRATCNPDADSWLAKFIAWWINQSTGYAIRERSGLARWFIRPTDNDAIEWGNSHDELKRKFGEDCEPASVSFIMGTISDNKIGMHKDPGYIGKLKALPMVDREQLLHGNWKVRPAAGLYFKRHYFTIEDCAPPGTDVRVWDLAATKKREGNKADWTSGMKMRMDDRGVFHILDVRREQYSPAGVEQMIEATASQDGSSVAIGIPQDPGQAGLAQADHYVKLLAGYNVRTFPVLGDKVIRAGPASSQAEHGNIRLLRGHWNEAFLNECVRSGTLIITRRGLVPIERVVAGDSVLTRHGWNSVLISELTSVPEFVIRIELSNGAFLEATGNHPVFVVGRGFVPASEVRLSERILCHKSARQLFKTGRSSHAAATPIILTAGGMARKRIGTGLFTSFTVERFPPNITFTMRTETPVTTSRQTSSACQSENTSLDTGRNGNPRNTDALSVVENSSHERQPAQSTAQASAPTRTGKYSESSGRDDVAGASSLLKPFKHDNSAAPSVAENCFPTQKSRRSLSVARSAVSNFIQNQMVELHVEEVVVSRLVIVCGGPVFNLKVDQNPEYFANGMLVHNCENFPEGLNDDMVDTLSDGVSMLTGVFGGSGESQTVRQSREIGERGSRMPSRRIVL